jgi:hypothetical protein
MRRRMMQRIKTRKQVFNLIDRGSNFQIIVNNSGNNSRKMRRLGFEYDRKWGWTLGNFYNNDDIEKFMSCNFPMHPIPTL